MNLPHWDLYITDSTCDPKLLASKTGDDAVAEFVGKKAVFYQNGTWAYNDVKDLGDDNLGMLPIYIGVDGEENQGLCTGSENFWCVNNNSSDADIQATLDFLYWCVTSEAVWYPRYYRRSSGRYFESARYRKVHFSIRYLHSP